MESLPVSSAKLPGEWPRGCDKCEHGLLGDVARGRQVYAPLYVVRAYQAKAKQITFCSCRAGKMYRKYLLSVWKRIESGEDYIPPAMYERIKDELATEPPPLPSVRQPLVLSPYDAVIVPPADDDDYVPSMHFDEVEVIAA